VLHFLSISSSLTWSSNYVWWGVQVMKPLKVIWIRKNFDLYIQNTKERNKFFHYVQLFSRCYWHLVLKILQRFSMHCSSPEAEVTSERGLQNLWKKMFKKLQTIYCHNFITHLKVAEISISKI
jgi:hypothetical protein